MHRICVLTRGRLWSLNPLCMEKGGCVCVCVCVCVGWGSWQKESVAGAGEQATPDTHTKVHLSTCCSVPQLSAASLPFVCSPCSQVFAIQRSSCLQSLPAYLQTVSSGVCNYHPSCSQPAPLDSCSHYPSCSVTFPAVCSYQNTRGCSWHFCDTVNLIHLPRMCSLFTQNTFHSSHKTHESSLPSSLF